MAEDVQDPEVTSAYRRVSWLVRMEIHHDGGLRVRALQKWTAMVDLRRGSIFCDDDNNVLTTEVRLVGPDCLDLLEWLTREAAATFKGMVVYNTIMGCKRVAGRGEFQPGGVKIPQQ